MKKREFIIYNNYNLYDNYNEIKEFLMNEYPAEEITEDKIYNKIYLEDSLNWEDEHKQLKDFFTGHGYFLLTGSAGRWNGKQSVGYIFNNFDDMFYKAVKDCNYIKIWDENGHFYIQCSHHDGTNFFEIKRINYKAYNFINNWAYNWNDKRTEEDIYNIIWNSNFLSALPHYAKIVYGELLK